MFSFGARESPTTVASDVHPSAENETATQPQVELCGQVIEYVQDRLYLAAYESAPNEKTPFPYNSTSKSSPHKRSSKQRTKSASSGPKLHPPCYFTIDDDLPYNRFYADFGPLHIGHLYRFSCTLNWLLSEPCNKDRAIVLWSKPDARSRANSACLLACYMVMSQSWPPHMALAPIAQAEPPFMPFRDAGYSQADFILTIQDVLYGVWKAKELGLCSLAGFDLDEYERYERVDQGDFNWLTSFFVALASPQHEIIETIAPETELYKSLPTTAADVEKDKNLSDPFRNVLSHFSQRNVGLVVRLNSRLYTPSYFNALGINHLDMIFDDGTVPPLVMVKKFIRITHDMTVNKKKAVAVHCKAGLGRTGCLMGAYLIYRYGFTGNEVIAFMRFMRPGMVVGPQQHWLHVHQGEFREWWYEDKIKAKLAAAMPTTPPKSVRRTHTLHAQTTTPPNGSIASAKRHALGDITLSDMNAAGNSMDENLPAPTPGQPRKNSRMDARHHPYARATTASLTTTTEGDDPDQQLVRSPSRQRETISRSERIEADDGGHQGGLQSRSSLHNRRTVSHNVSTGSTRPSRRAKSQEADELVNDLASDVENWTTYPSQADISSDKPLPSPRPRLIKAASRSGSGSGTLGVAKIRGTPVRRSGESREVKSTAGVRKTSTRVASMSGNISSTRAGR